MGPGAQTKRVLSERAKYNGPSRGAVACLSGIGPVKRCGVVS